MYCKYCNKILNRLEENRYGDCCEDHYLQFGDGMSITPVPRNPDEWPDDLAEEYDDYRGDPTEELYFE